MEVSPFPYQGPLPPDRVRGRDGLLQDLAERVTERRVTALLGPRRFGKTSVLRRLAADLTEVSTIAIDLFGVQTHADAVVRLSSAMQAAVPSIREPAVELSVEAGIDLGGLQAKLALSPARRPDARALFDQLVQMLVTLGRRMPLLLVFDEFQSLTTVDGATAVLRTRLQHHYADVGLIFAGSAPSAMRDVFTRHDQPFFNQADLVTIEPLDLAAVHAIVVDGFADTGRDAGSVAGNLFDLTGGHPQRTMRAADQVWRLTGPGESADGRWGRALTRLRDAEAGVLAATYDDLTATEKKVVRIYANGGSIYGSAAERLELSPGAANHARDRLLADGKLRHRDEGDIVVTDPLLADWLVRRLPL
ncbi:AAA family ATPase [Egicoccus halophilus]|uniref:ATPase n=1 Tax=Egicoccus halophilus TaxID=1670830 RepID=A0A8J3ESR0_9ACTN|nr:AAA family ATPase [Egicoccus halophilus]GGI03562.1 ATPase [Egicoccus halophilus]